MARKQQQDDGSFTTTFSVSRTPQEAFDAVTNLRGWWSEEIEGDTDVLGAEFSYHYGDVHRCKMRVTELVPGKRVVYRVLENHFDFTRDKKEWIDTELRFEVSEKGGTTRVDFVHHGLVADYECYDVCEKAWGFFVGTSLRQLITTGKGQATPKQEPTPKQQAKTTARGESGGYRIIDFRIERVSSTGKPAVLRITHLPTKTSLEESLGDEPEIHVRDRVLDRLVRQLDAN